MTPKLYEEVNTKFFSIWGDYAGWAHSVGFRLPSFFKKNIHSLFLQVLFTADLKSFSSYGLEAPPSAPSSSDSRTPEEKTEKHLPPLQSVLGLQNASCYAFSLPSQTKMGSWARKSCGDLTAEYLWTLSRSCRILEPCWSGQKEETLLIHIFFLAALRYKIWPKCLWTMEESSWRTSVPTVIIIFC